MIFIILTSQISGILSPGLLHLAISRAQERPNTTNSSNELAPRRLAPWTDVHAASPQAYNPGTTLSSPFLGLMTCTHYLNTEKYFTLCKCFFKKKESLIIIIY